ncbi:NUDIX hydrolase [Actinomadura viridis]|uniref:NUDIX hydrolase n=1 Tax=Actinomadura viridis TaxID=58110 RepID=UPI0036A3077E
MPDLPPVAAAVIVERGRVLLVRRRHPEGDLVWQLPAGELEDGETAAQAAERETAEETGLKVTAGRVLGSRVHPDTGRFLLYVVCEAVGGYAHVADDEEIAEVAWVELDGLADFLPRPFFGPVQEHLDALLHAR